MRTLPLTYNFRDRPVIGDVHLSGYGNRVKNLQDYYIVPCVKQSDNGHAEVIAYSLVHRSKLPATKGDQEGL